VPVHAGEKGNPVLWGRRHFPLLFGLSGDRGARGLIDQLTDEVVEVTISDASVLTDVDTADALQRLATITVIPAQAGTD
jgi:molybdenum cofactor cytidylyltransferase